MVYLTKETNTVNKQLFNSYIEYMYIYIAYIKRKELIQFISFFDWFCIVDINNIEFDYLSTCI